MALSQAALTTLAELKGALSITDSLQDTKLETLIESASAAAAKYCEREFHRVDDNEEKLSGYSSMFLRVTRTPLLAINSITYDGSTIAAAGYEIDDADLGMIYSLSGWTWTSSTAGGSVSVVELPGTERKLYTVDYDGGYVTPNQVSLGTFATRTLPHDLEQAVVSMAVDSYRAAGRDSAIESEKVLSAAIQYRVDAGTIGPQARSVLDSYRLAVFA